MDGGREVEGPRCYWHPLKRAKAICVSCGRAVCADCDRLVGYRHHCPLCHSAAAAPQAWGPGTHVPPVPPSAGPYPPPSIPPPSPFTGPPPPSSPIPPSPPYPGPGYLPAPPPSFAAAGEPPEPEEPRERRWWRADWKLSEVTAALFVIFGIYNLLGVVLMLTTENPLFYEYLSYALFFCPLIILCTAWILKRHGRGWKELGLNWDRPLRLLLSGLGGGVAALTLSYAAFFALYFLFYLIAGRPPSMGETEELRGIGGGGLTLVVMVVVLFAPVFEEIFFRGLFYSALRRRLGPRAAIAVNGIIFGALHFQPPFMISLVLVGMVLAYLYEKTDSLFAPMAAHSLYNLAVVLASLFIAW